MQFCCKHKKGIGSLWLTASSLSWEHRARIGNERGYAHLSTPQRGCEERAKRGCWHPAPAGRGEGGWKALPALHPWDTEQGPACPSVGGCEKGAGERDGAGWEAKYEELEAVWRAWDWEKGQPRCPGKRRWDLFGTERRRDDWSHPCRVAGKLLVDDWFNPSAPTQEKLAKTVVFLLSRLQLLCHRQGPAVPQTLSGGK